MSEEPEDQVVSEPELLYPLNARPPFVPALLAAFQHLMAIFVGIITPSIIIGGILGLGHETAYLVSMSLLISGVATFIQCRRFGPVGSGLLSIQGTSFSFLGAVVVAGGIAKSRGADEAGMLAMIFGVCFVGSVIEMVLSRFLHLLRKIITPTVTGIVVTLIGFNLIGVALKDIGGGAWLLQNHPEQFGSWQNLALGGFVFLLIIALNRSRNPYVRMGSIMIGLLVGYGIAVLRGMVDFSQLAGIAVVTAPVPFKYGFAFSMEAFIPVAFIYLITTIETIGDLTATSVVSNEPITGDLYLRRIKGGVLGDGVNSMLAAAFNTFPNTTFSQNNGVIQLTGVASRYVGYYIAALLALLGLFPVIGGVFQGLPKPVLGGATLVMFGTVAAAGIRIIASAPVDRRAMLILAVSYGLGIGVLCVPETLAHAPTAVRNIFSSPITTGGLAALLTSALLPREKKQTAQP
ncbi:MAG: nucleobase:cation symporter-2 family protein [Kiritimatiellae bacterium]|nr:nucleobase:cation symporter-2 family protein [Kiritimatiellia bacterium]